MNQKLEYNKTTSYLVIFTVYFIKFKSLSYFFMLCGVVWSQET